MSPEDGQCMTETCRRKLETMKVIYTFISAFVVITYMNKIFINAVYGTHTVSKELVFLVGHLPSIPLQVQRVTSALDQTMTHARTLMHKHTHTP